MLSFLLGLLPSLHAFLRTCFLLAAAVSFAASGMLAFAPAVVRGEEYEWGCIQEFTNDGVEVTRCGFGYWRTLCGWNAGVEECETFFELVEEAPEPAASSVLFLPGIKGSRLYGTAAGCEGSESACRTKLWEPRGNESTERLYLNGQGRSLDSGVYTRTGDTLSSALGQRFYESFFDDLDAAAASGTYGPGWRWEAGAYDWRLSLEDLVTKGEREDDRIYYARSTSLPYLETQLLDLADDSPSGKVTLIAHSNGGLVAKTLMQELGDSEAASLIDSVIFVGVPHFGAPQALGALLFGYGEALPFDRCASWKTAGWLCALLLDRPTARTFAAHAPMAYHLLPSESYFDDPEIAREHPVVRFSAERNFLPERKEYGELIDSAQELYGFAAAREGGRVAPMPEDTGRASVLSEPLLAYASEVHDALDSWEAPEGIATYRIIGTQRETVSGIDFYDEPHPSGVPIPRYRPTFMHDGDGVVPAVSARGYVTSDNAPHAETGEEHRRNGTDGTYWIDLQGVNERELGGGLGHGTLFEIEGVRTLLAKLVSGESPEAIAHVSTEVPQAERPHWLRFFLHSPLTLELYAGDAHLGFNKYGTFDDEIPGASYGEFGEVKYLTVPAGHDYQLELRGQGTGSFSLDIEEEEGDERTMTSIFGVPVTPELIVQMEISADRDTGWKLKLDHDGDGATDKEIVLEEGATTPYPPSPVSPPPGIVDDEDQEKHSARRDTADAVSSTTLSGLFIEEVATPELPASSSGHLVEDDSQYFETSTSLPDSAGRDLGEPDASVSSSSRVHEAIPEDLARDAAAETQTSVSKVRVSSGAIAGIAVLMTLYALVRRKMLLRRDRPVYD